MKKGLKKGIAAFTSAATVLSGASAMIGTGMNVYAADITDTIDVSNASASDDGNVTVNTDDGTIFTIGVSGTYEITGSASNVGIVVAEGVDAGLILNGVTINDSAYTGSAIESVIYADKKSDVSITLNGTSTFKCNSDNSKLESGIKHQKKTGDDALSISGTGSLEITGTSGDGIKYKNGSVSISSAATYTVARNSRENTKLNSRLKKPLKRRAPRISPITLSMQR